MRTPALHARSTHLATALTLALATALLASLPAAAFDSSWTKPKRVFSAGYAPSQSMVAVDGRVHIASERGTAGVWYITNASGAWTQCQVSSSNDRQPSIDVAGGVVHIAFARKTSGLRGIYTASSDQSAAVPGCGWAVTRRFAGSATHPSLAAYGGTLSVAFRTGAKLLKFIKGPAAASTWTVKQTIDSGCCTSAPALAITHAGAPRVAYGDGTARANGLKYAVRTEKGWKKAKVAGGRIRHVAMVLDTARGLFGETPGNGPRIAYAVKNKGSWLASKGSGGLAGAWGKRYLDKAAGPIDVTYGSNVTQVVHTRNGNLGYARHSGGIWSGGQLSGGGSDTRPQLDGGLLTFSRKKGTTGVFFTQRK